MYFCQFSNEIVISAPLRSPVFLFFLKKLLTKQKKYRLNLDKKPPRRNGYTAFLTPRAFLFFMPNLFISRHRDFTSPILLRRVGQLWGLSSRLAWELRRILRLFLKSTANFCALLFLFVLQA